MYYFLRVHNIKMLNITKVLSSVTGLIIFLIVVPISNSLIFVPFLVSLLITSLPIIFDNGISRRLKLHNVISKSIVIGWMIFGGQALVQGFSQNGLRVIIGEYISFADVGVFTKTYLIASSVFFIFSAIMIKYEAKLAQRSGRREFLLKIRPLSR